MEYTSIEYEYHHVRLYCVRSDPAFKPIDEVSTADFRNLLEINLVSMFTFSKVYCTVITRSSPLSYFSIL